MKNIIIFRKRITQVILISLIFILNRNTIIKAQNVAITDDDGYECAVSAILDVKSLTKGLLFPRLTTIQRNEIVSPTAGLVVYDINVKKLFLYDGTGWKDASAEGIWLTNGTKLYTSNLNYRMGIGSNNPNSKLEVKADSTFLDTDTLFVVKDKHGKPVFVVFPDGAQVIIDTSLAKGSVGGFAVSGRTPAKYGQEPYLLVRPDSTRVYVNESSNKGSVGGFAVSGRTPGKGESLKIMDLTPKNYLIGQEAGKSLTTGSYNSYMGFQAGKSTRSGSKNIFIGYQSGYKNIGGTGDLGSYNVYLGYQAGYSDTTGWGNTAIGYLSLYSNTIGYNNVANGYQSLYTNYNGNFNVANGYQALYLNYSGAYNVANGYQALYKNTIGEYNVANGYQALFSNTSGIFNTAEGYQAMYYNSTAQQNVAIGYSALFNANTNYNVAVGNSALYSNTTGSYNTALGFSAFWSGTAYVNSTAIGYGTGITASTQVRIGNAGITSIGGYVGWTTLPSDKRFKKNIVENVPGLAFVLKLRPVTYNIDMDAIAKFLQTQDDSLMNDLDTFKGNMLQTGFVAQEVETAANEIGFDFCGIDKPKNKNDFYGIRYAEFTVPLVKAVQELNYKIETQQLQIEATSAENRNLKNELQSIKSELEAMKAELKNKK